MRAMMSRFAAATALVFAVITLCPLTASASENVGSTSSAVVETERVLTPPADAGEAGNGELADGVAPAHKRGDRVQATAWGYQIMPSCANLAAPIRQGAGYWEGATETPGSGKPVECTNGYIDCFGVNAVGCNFGPGQIIMLSTQVPDFALLAAHEFGHEWHPHSAAGCMNWASAYEVMRPTVC